MSEAAEKRRYLTVAQEFTPKTYDIDASGHVSNISYIRWLEDLRLAWLEEYHPLQKQAEEGIMPALLRTEIDYIKQIRLFEKVVGEIWLEDRGRLRWNLHFRFTVEGEVRATAKQVGIWFRPENGKPVRPPAPILEAYEREVQSRNSQQGDRT